MNDTCRQCAVISTGGRQSTEAEHKLRRHFYENALTYCFTTWVILPMVVVMYFLH